MFESEPEIGIEHKSEAKRPNETTKQMTNGVQGRSSGKHLDYKYPRYSEMSFLAIDLQHFSIPWDFSS